MSDAVEIESVTKRFGSFVAVDGVDFSVPRGSLCGVLGPNGAGKSTTIRMINAILMPDEGSIRVLGKRPSEAKDRVGYLPEERGLYRRMEVMDLLRYLGRLRGVPEQELDRRIRAWLERVHLAGVERNACQELSKGMQQKIQFVAAILHEPELIILDEPFSGLDPVSARLLRNIVDELHQEGRTILFSTHVMYQAEQLCDRVVLIHRGRKRLDLSMRDIHATFDPKIIEVEPLAMREDAAVILQQIAGLRSCVWDQERRRVELRVADDADPQRVMARALELVPVRSVALRRPTLDDVFVAVVGEAMASSEEAGNG
jgi:ABC-2 type transport system ATP-binding protein